MGLDNGITCRITSKEKNFERCYEICYWRKYWGLRDNILIELDHYGEDCYEWELDENDILSIKDILEYFCDIEKVKEAELSTIWNNEDEVEWIKKQYRQISVAFDYLQNKISLKQFTDALNSWQWMFTLEGWKKEEELWQQILESPPDDLKIVFEFYDSY